MRRRVLVSTRLLPAGFDELLGKYEVVFPETGMFSTDELLNLLPHFDAFIPTFQCKVDKAMIDAAASRIRIIANYGVGYNNIDVEYAAQKGIVVTNTPDPVVEPTAELALALMHAAARRVAECDRKLRVADGLKWGVLENLGLSLYGKTLGIVGMGRIGQALARRAVACGMEIVYYNRKRLDPVIENRYNARWVSLDDLLTLADVVSLHTPLTDATHHLIDAAKLELMKSTAILVNTARGPVVDEQALAIAVQSKKIYAAALDVYELEPHINELLLRQDNVVLLPHVGTATVDARNEMSRFASQNIIRFFEGRSDYNRVN